MGQFLIFNPISNLAFSSAVTGVGAEDIKTRVKYIKH